MADAGLPNLNTRASGAGLGDGPMTMADRQFMLDSFNMIGGGVPPAERPGATMSDTSADTPDAMGRMGLIGYGMANRTEGLLQGAGDFLGDRLGMESARDLAYDVGEALGPSEEADRAYAQRMANPDRNFGSDVADAITMEAGPTVTTIGAAAAAGAAAGTLTGVPVLGTLAGAAVGAGVGFFAMRDEARDKAKQYKAQAKYGEAATPDQIKEQKLDDDEMARVDYAALGGAAMEAITPLRIAQRLVPGMGKRLAGELASKALIKGTLKKGAADALIEGSTEVGQLALTEMMVNPELRQRMTEDDVQETAAWVAETFGREAALNFAAGFGLGGAAGMPAAAHEISVNNAKRKRDVELLARAGEAASVDLSDFENAARDKARVGQLVKDAEDIRGVAGSLDAARRQRDEYAAKPEDTRDPELMAELDATVARQQARFDAKHDEVMPRYGGLTKSEMDERRAQVEQETRRSAVDRARTQGFDVDDTVDVGAVHGAMEPLEQAKADYERAVRKRDTTVDPNFRNKYGREADKAKAKIRAAEINARKVMYGESPKDAAAQLDREAGVRRHRERLFGAEADPQAVIARADEIIAERADLGKTKAARQATREKIARLYAERDDAGTESGIAEIEAKIAKEQAKLKQPDPLVEAATLAKRDAQKALGIEPSVEELTDPMAGVFKPEGTQEVEGMDAAAPAGAEATVEAPATPIPAPQAPEPAAPEPGALAPLDQASVAALSGTTPTEGGRAPNTTEAEAVLPEDHGRYFDMDADGATAVPIDRLRPVRARPEGIANGGAKMRQAYDGQLTRRAPISVRAERDGTYTVLDGNSTFANMRQAGWTEAPVRVVDDAQFAREAAPKFGKKTGTRTSTEGSTLIARGPEARREGAEKRAAKEGLTLRFEATDTTQIPADDTRRSGMSVGRQTWQDHIDTIGADAGVEDVTDHLLRTAPKVEYMAHIDADGRLLGFGTNGNPNAVAVSDAGTGMKRGTTIHNHPIPTPFSGQDIVFMAGRSAEGFTSRVVTDGHVIEMKPAARLEEMSVPEALKTVSNYLRGVERAATQAQVPLTHQNSHRVLQEAVLRIATLDKLIDYSSPFQTLTPEEESHVNTILDAYENQVAVRERAGGNDLRVRDDAGTGTAADGQPTPGGGGGTAAQEGSAAIDRSAIVADEGADPARLKDLKAEWKAAQKKAFPTLDAVLAAALANDIKFQTAMMDVARQAGVKFHPGPVKTRESIELKLRENGLKGKDTHPGSLGDVVRGGFVVQDAAEAERLVEVLKGSGPNTRMRYLLENWNTRPTGYTDRALVGRMPDGQLVEIQLWEPHMLLAKQGVDPGTNKIIKLPFTSGHTHYEIWRDSAQPKDARDRADAAMRRLYASALALAAPDVQQLAVAQMPTVFQYVDAATVQQIKTAMRAPATPRQAGPRVDMAPVTLPEAFAMVEDTRFDTNRDLKVELQRRALAAQRAAGIDLTTPVNSNTPKATLDAMRGPMVDALAVDAEYALEANPNAMGWYDDKLRRAMSTMETVYPELGTDPHAHFQFVWALAATSNGQKVDKNFQYAARAYDGLRRDGKFPTLAAGVAQVPINNALGLYHRMVDRYGQDATEKLMVSTFPVSVLERMGLSVSGENPDTEVRGAAVLGPKIGTGFFSNLYGFFDALTMDRWLMRTVKRIQGTLIETNAPATAKKRAGLRAAVDHLTPVGVVRLRAVLAHRGYDTSHIGPGMTDAQLDDLARAIQRRTAKPEVRNALDKIPGRGAPGAEIRKAGNMMAKYLDGQVEAPANGYERNFIRDVFAGVLKRMRDNPKYVNLTMADLQAALWYPEKRLYDSAKAGEVTKGYADDEAPDYANAAQRFAAQRGVGAGRQPTGARPASAAGSGAFDGRSQGFDERAKRDFIRRSVTATAIRGGDADGPVAVSGLVAAKSGGDAGSVRRVGAPIRQTLTPTPKFRNALKAAGIPHPAVHELDAAAGAPVFEKAIKTSKLTNPFGAAVHAYEVDDYAGMRLFVTEDKQAGFAVKPDGDIVSVFVTQPKGSVNWLIQAARSQGGTKLDAFDTVLPAIYAENGFEPVARLPWNDEYTPEGWSKELFAPFNNGEPDVVYFRFNPDFRGDGDTARLRYADNPDDAAAAQDVPAGDPSPFAQEVSNATDQRTPGTARANQSRDGQTQPRGTRGGSRRLADGGLAPLAGAPTLRGHKGPIQNLVKVAERYARDNGIALVPQGEFVKVDPARARRIADAYEAMPHAPRDPKVAAAYADLARQTRAQYDALAQDGYRFFFFAPDSPYGDSPITAMEDLRLNKRMGVFPTDAGFGSSDLDVSENPLLADTGLTWPDERGAPQRVLANDLFRAVHDAFGHGLEGSGFRADGEENAWQAHIRLFTGPAKGAITSETRGQNSWLNYGPHAATNQTAAVEDTIFADQKTGIMPEWTWTEGLAPDAPDGEVSAARTPIPMVPGQPAPLYVHRPVVDDGGLRAWAKAAGVEGVLPLDKMHLTVTYSRSPVDVASVPARAGVRKAKALGRPTMMGSNADTLTMPLSTGALGIDHNRYRKAGASHDYDSGYKPHISIKYDATPEDLAKLRKAPPFTGTVTLGPEQQEQLRPGGVPAENVKTLLDAARERITAKTRKAAVLADAGRPVQLRDADGQRALAGPDVSKPGGFRLTYLAADGGPNGHREFASLMDAIRAGLDDGFTPDGAGEIAQAVDLPDYIDIGYRDTGTAMQGALNIAKNPTRFASGFIDRVEDGFFNGFAPIRRLEVAVTGKLAEGAESAYKAAEMAVNDSGRQEALLFYGAAKQGPHGEFQIAPGTKGLRTIFDDVAGPDKDPQRLADWMAVMAAKRAQDLHARGIPTPLTQTDIQNALAKDNAAFQQAAADWKAHNDANIDFLVDTGRITGAQANAMKADQHYVPFYRSDAQKADGSSPDFSLDEYLGAAYNGRPATGAVLKRNPGIQKIVGGDKLAIDNLMLNMIRNSQAMVAAGMRNRAANQSFDLMEMAGLATKVSATKTNKRGVTVRKEKPANSVRMWVGGKEKFVVVSEEGAPLVAALGGLHPRQRGVIEHLLVQIAAVFRQGITITPAFMIRNAIRGAVSTGIMTSGSNLTAANNSLTGFVDAIRKGDATRAFKHQSGMGDYRFGAEDAGFGQNDILIDYGLAPKTIMSRLRAALNKAEAVGTATELADRVAAYKTWVANGVRPDEAAYQALTIMNYSRRGNSSVVQVMAPMVPFLNARLQGLSRMMEGAVGKRGAVGRKEAMMRVALNGAVLSMASLALWAWNNDDDEKRAKYLAEPLFKRLNYHPIYAGDTTIYIPKAFELGSVFSSVPEMFADAAFNDMGDQVLPATKAMLAQTFLFNAIPAGVLPMVEGMTNHSFFRDAAIEGMRESRLRARDRITGASPLAIAIGQKLGVSDATRISPAMIEHYLQGYGGAYYHLMSASFEMVGQELGLTPATPMGAMGDIPVGSPLIERAVGSIIRDGQAQTGKYVEDFYNAKTHVDQIYMSAKEAATHGDIEYARNLLAQVPGLEVARTLINKAAPKMTDLNAAIRLIRLDDKLTRRQKTAQLRPLIQTRNELTRQVAGAVRQIEAAQGRTFASAS